MKETKKVFKWWAGYNASKIEKWLETEENSGWNLENISKTGLWFTFKKGKPRKIAYRIDYQPQAKEDYIQLFEDAGWVLMTKGAAGWYYWCQKFKDEKPEIFSDNESLIERNKRQMWFLLIIYLVQIPSIKSTINSSFLSKSTSSFSFFILGVIILQCILFIILSIILIKFFIANRKLNKKNKL